VCHSILVHHLEEPSRRGIGGNTFEHHLDIQIVKYFLQYLSEYYVVSEPTKNEYALESKELFEE
jgi:hypothetical protein